MEDDDPLVPEKILAQALQSILLFDDDDAVVIERERFANVRDETCALNGMSGGEAVPHPTPCGSLETGTTGSDAHAIGSRNESDHIRLNPKTKIPAPAQGYSSPEPSSSTPHNSPPGACDAVKDEEPGAI